MASFRDVLVRATLKDECIEHVQKLLKTEEWTTIAEESPAAKEMASEEDSRWIPFIDHSGYGGTKLVGNVFSFRCTLINRASDLIKTMSDWLSEVSTSWEMVNTSDHADDGFFVSSLQLPDYEFVQIPFADEGRGDVAYHVGDFLPQSRDWSPEMSIGPLEHSMQPVVELNAASSRLGTRLGLNSIEQAEINLVAKSYIESARKRREKYRTPTKA